MNLRINNKMQSIINAIVNTVSNLFIKTDTKVFPELVNHTLNNLKLMNKHYVIAARKPGYREKDRQYIEQWAKAILILQTISEIAHEDWRKANPTFTRNYMGIQLIFSSDELYNELKRIHDITMLECPNANNFILRSNDGITAENPEEQKWV